MKRNAHCLQNIELQLFESHHLKDCCDFGPNSFCEGWAGENVKSRYIRLLGVDVAGATEKLEFNLPKAAKSEVVNFIDFRANRQSEERDI